LTANGGPSIKSARQSQKGVAWIAASKFDGFFTARSERHLLFHHAFSVRVSPEHAGSPDGVTVIAQPPRRSLRLNKGMTADAAPDPTFAS
jgi:hypothetical protein